MDPYGHSLGPRLGGGYGSSVQNVQPLIGMGTNANAAQGVGRQSSDMSASQMEDAAFAARMLGLSGDLLGSSSKPAATATMLGSSLPAQQAFSQGTQQTANIPGMQQLQQPQQAANIPGMQQLQQTQQASNIPGMQQQQQQQQFNPAAAALLRNTLPPHQVQQQSFNQGIQQTVNIPGMQQLQQSLKNYGIQQQPQPEVGIPAIQQQQQHREMEQRQPNIQMMNSSFQEKQGGFSNDAGVINQGYSYDNQRSPPRQDRSNPSMSSRRSDNQSFERSQDDRRGDNTRGNDRRGNDRHGNDRRSSGRDGGNRGDQRRSGSRGGDARDKGSKDRGSRDRNSGGGGQGHQVHKVDNQAAQLQQLQTQLKLQETLDRLQRLEEAQKKKDQHMEEMEHMLRKRKRDDERNMSSKHSRQELSSLQDPPRGPYFEAGPPPNIDPYMDLPPMRDPYMEPADHNRDMNRDFMDDPRHDPRGEMGRDFMDAPRQEPNLDMARDFMETTRRSRSQDMARDFNDRRSPSHDMARDPSLMPGGTGRGRGAGRGSGMARSGSDRSRTTPRGGSDGGRGPSRGGSDGGRGPSRGGSDRGRGKPRGGPGKGGVKRLTPNAPVGQGRSPCGSRTLNSRANQRRKNSSGDTGGQQQGRRSAGQQQSGHSGPQPNSRSGGPQRGGRRGGPQQVGPSGGRQQDGGSGSRSQQQQRIQQKGKMQHHGPPPGQSSAQLIQLTAYRLQQQAISALPMKILATSNYCRGDLEKAYYQEMNKITENLLILPELPPPKKDINMKVQMFCYGCQKDDHVVSQCKDPVIVKEKEMENAALGSTTVSHQMKLFYDMKFKDHIYNKKLHNLHCYFCNSKSKSLGEYYIHVENKTHQKNVDKVWKTFVGDPNRIPLVMRLAELPNVQAEAKESKTGAKTGEKGEASTQDKTKDDDYSFLCPVCKILVAGPWKVHSKTKKHQMKLEYCPRCTTCRIYCTNKNHEKNWLHIRMLFLSRRSRNVSNLKERELTARSKSAVNDKPTANDKPAAKDKPAANDKPAAKDKPTANDKPAAKDKAAAKDKPADKQEATKSVSEPGIPSGAVAGMEFVFPVTGWFCKVCQKFYPNVSKVDHCSQDVHHDNLVQWCRKRDISMATLLKRYLAKDDPSSTSSQDELNSSDLVVIDDVSMNDESDADNTQMESSTTDQLMELSDEVNEEAGVQGDDGMIDVDKIGSVDEDEDVDIEGEDEEEWDADKREDSFYGDPEGHLIGDDDHEDDDNFVGMEDKDCILEDKEGILEEVEDTLEDEEDILEDAPAEMSGDVTGDKDNEADEEGQVDEEAKPVEDGGSKEGGQDGGEEAEKDEGVKGKQDEGEKEEQVEGKKEEKVEGKKEEQDAEVEKEEQDDGKKEEQEGDTDEEKGEQDEEVQGKQDDRKKEEQVDGKKEEQEGVQDGGEKGGQDEGKNREQGGEKEEKDDVATYEGKTEESKDVTDKEVATEAKPKEVAEKTTPPKRTRRTTRKK